MPYTLIATLSASGTVQHFAARDLLGSLWATAIFAPLLYCPGYIVGFLTNVFEFRAATVAQRSLWALALSLVTVPIAGYLLARCIGLQAVEWVIFCCTVCTAALFLSPGLTSVSRLTRRVSWPAASLVFGWIAFVLLELVDVQAGNKLYFSVVLADQSYRVAFTSAVMRGGVPPANPLYFAHSPAAMHYYYFWYVLCATVAKMAHVTARQAFTASSIWAGFGLIATTKLYASHFFHWPRKTQWIAVGLLAVSGLDLIPALGNAVLQPLNGDIEWWSVDPIDAWPDSLLWVPHHVASVLCCLLAFLFLWKARTQRKRTQSFLQSGFAATAFASAFGLSVYVACGFVIMLALWTATLWLSRQPERQAWTLRLLLTGAISFVLLSPFLLELYRTTPSPPQGKPGLGSVATPRPLTLSVRRLIDSELVTGAPIFDKLRRSHPALLDQSVRLLLLIPGLALEMGLFGIVLVWLWRARRKSSAVWPAEQQVAFSFVMSGLVLSLFVSSSVITNNDFGYRAVMLPQFFWTLLTAELLGSWHAGGSVLVPPTLGKRRSVRWLLGVGAAGTVYGAVLLRVWLPAEERRPKNGFAQLSQEAYQLRAAFDLLHAQASPRDVVAFRPIDPEIDRGSEVMTPNEFYQRLLVTNAGQQMLNAEGKCAIHFGGDADACSAIQHATEKLYNLPFGTATDARNYCQQFGVNFLVLGHRDPSWQGASYGWPTELPVVDREPGVLVVRCDRAGS